MQIFFHKFCKKKYFNIKKSSLGNDINNSNLEDENLCKAKNADTFCCCLTKKTSFNLSLDKKSILHLTTKCRFANLKDTVIDF